MITHIELKNYKAFEYARIPLKPITILLGANSVGKSSILQFLLMLQQTNNVGIKSYKSALKLYGGNVNLGEPVNIFRNRDTKKPIEISFEIKNSRIKDFVEKDLLSPYINSFKYLTEFISLKAFKDIKDKKINNKKTFEEYIDAFISVQTSETTKPEIKKHINMILNHSFDVYLPSFNSNNKNSLLKTYDALIKLNKTLKNNDLKISYKISYSNNTLITSYFKVEHEEHNIFELSNTDGKITIKSEIFNFIKKDLDIIENSFHQDNTIFSSFSYIRSKLIIKNQNKQENQTLISNIVLKLIDKIQLDLSKEFSEESINYVSPLRAHPKRYYMLDKAKVNITLDTLDGDAIAEVLKHNSAIKSKVNKWFSNFGLQINVKEFKEVIHHLKVRQNNLDLDITDVGFGISQILPVILQGFMSKNNSKTIIEQPEIHLHPKMQADLGDLFIDIIQNSTSKSLIIETHSEYLLKRIRRRISEGNFNYNNLAVCILKSNKDGSGNNLETIPVENKGFFEWPEDFYGGEIYNDTIEFLKNQN